MGWSCIGSERRVGFVWVEMGTGMGCGACGRYFLLCVLCFVSSSVI